MNDYARRLWMSQRQPRNEAPGAVIEGTVATIRLYDPVDSWGDMFGVSAKEFVTVLDELPDEVNEIRLHINSPGGDVFDGIAILNALRAHDAKVVAVIDGIAASAASFIACGADELVMARNSELMIHDAWGLCVGNSADMIEMADILDRLSDNIASIYADKAGGGLGKWRAAMAKESWYSAAEAVEAGLADRVDKKKPASKNAFDLSVFNFAGRSAAPAPADDPDPPIKGGKFSEHKDAALRGVKTLVEMAVDRLTIRAAEGKSITEQVGAYDELVAEIAPLKSAIDATHATSTDDQRADEILASALTSFIAQGA